ncbi:MAG: IniB N-terminal domain-containing protein, partial [Canibacter sp.]
MAVTTAELLRFILDLLGDPAKAEEFTEDPSGALSSAGLSGVSCADVDAIAPLIANSVPGAVAIAGIGGPSATPAQMIDHLVQNVAVSNFDNSGLMQTIW